MVNVGETSVEPVVVGISGPDHVYTGVPAPPPPDVAVSVIVAPRQNAGVADELSDERFGCAVTVYSALTVEAGIQPVPE